MLTGREAPAQVGSRAASRVGVVGKTIWDEMVMEGTITDSQLDIARRAQDGDSRDIGRTLVSMNFVTDEQIARAGAKRLRLDYLDLTENDVDRSVLGLVAENLLRKHHALPLRMQDGDLIVAVSDPLNIQALEDLRISSGQNIQPVVATEGAIDKALIKVFAYGENVSNILEESDIEEEKTMEELDLGISVKPDERPIVRLVSSVLQQAISDGASDIHIEPRASHLTIRFRVDGMLREIMTVPPKFQSGIVARMKILANVNIAEKRLPQDGRFSVKVGGKKVDFRVATLPTVFGEKIVLRLLESTNAVLSLLDLGYSRDTYERYRSVFTRPYGAVLVTGPTGSGKSTSLYATLSELNTPEKNIITVEDPVEYRIDGINQVQINQKVGLSFASALRNILRSDPDVVMIGEIRDHETAKIAVESALTGHLVLATLHTNDAPSALNRLTDMGVEPFLTASAVDCVIAQRLARRLCRNCREPIELSDTAMHELGFPHHVYSGAMDFHRAVGCDKCGGSGYSGRLGLYELMVVNEGLRDLVLARKSNDEMIRAARDAGMVGLRDDGLVKAAQGMTTVEEILRTVI